MIKLDSDLLDELGLGSLPLDKKNSLLQHWYETIELQVGMTMAERMTAEQLDEFEVFIDSKDEAGALRWLEEAFPDYKDVVAAVFADLKAEVAANVDRILASVES